MKLIKSNYVFKNNYIQDYVKFIQGVQVDIEKQKEHCEDGYVKFLRIENFTKMSSDFRYVKKEKNKEKYIDKDEIAMVRYGNTTGFVCRGQKGLLANNLFRVSPLDINNINNSFLFYYLNSNHIKHWIDNRLQGGAMKALNFKTMKKMPFPCVNFDEQKRIADLLDQQQELIDLYKEKLSILEQQESYYQDELLSGRLRIRLIKESMDYAIQQGWVEDGDIVKGKEEEFENWLSENFENKVEFYENQDFQDVKLNNIETKVPSDWSCLKFKKCIFKTSEGGTPPTKSKENYENGSIIWVTVDDIKKFIYNSRKKISEQGFKNSSTHYWDENDLILSTGATIGEVGIVKNKLCTKQGITGIKLNEYNYYKYWYFLLKNSKSLLKRFSNGTTFLSLTKESLYSLDFLIPSKKEQIAISLFIDEIEKTINLINKKIKVEEEKMEYLMDELLSGRIRIEE